MAVPDWQKADLRAAAQGLLPVVVVVLILLQGPHMQATLACSIGVKDFVVRYVWFGCPPRELNGGEQHDAAMPSRKP